MAVYRRGLLALLAIIILFVFFRGSQTNSSTDSKSSKRRSDVSRSKFSLFSSGSQQNQRSLTELSFKPLRSQLAYLFPYDPTIDFPAYIWQTWKTTSSAKDFSDDWWMFEKSWTELHPHFTHQIITDSAAEHIIYHLYSSIPDVVEAYISLPRPVLKADFFRYLILLARGGIYTDIDTAAIRPQSEWVPSNLPRSAYGLVIGIEADPDRSDWKEWYSRRIQFCQWTIQAKRGHPALREIVARVTEETLRRKRVGSLHTYVSSEVIEFTGPAAWTDAVIDYFNDKQFFNIPDTPGYENITWKQFTGMNKQRKVGDVVVLPITCFSPGVRQMGAGEDDDAMAFVKHTFDGSWKPKRERWIGDPERDKKMFGIKIGHA